MEIYLVLLFVSSILAIAVVGNDMTAMNMVNLSTGVNAFNFKMQKEISKTTEGNIIFSPFSIFTVLCMLASGAGTNTRKEIANALQQKEEQLLSLFNNFKPMNEMLSTNGESGNTLKLANKIWIAENIVVLDSYKRAIEEYFGSDIGNLSLTNAESSRLYVNKWVEQQTSNNIKELLPSGYIGPETKVILTNAVYFKGKWAQNFYKEDTYPDSFYTANGKKVKVSYMFQNGKFSSAIDKQRNVQLLELPYNDGQYSMVFAMPLNSRDKSGKDIYMDVGKLEEKIDGRVFNYWIKLLPEISKLNAEVDISVPKFEMKQSFELSEQLKKMGVLDVFIKEKADLSGINGKRNLYINTAIHKSLLKVDEEGTTAAAATALGANSMPITVTLNRPFVFYLIHKSCNAIIFSGKVMNPIA